MTTTAVDTDKNDANTLKKVNTLIGQIIENPEQLIEKNLDLAKKATKASKIFYDYEKTQDFPALQSRGLPTLITEGLHTDQIWEQIRLYSDPLLVYLENKLETLESSEDDLKLLNLEVPLDIDVDQDDESGDGDGDEDIEMGEEEADEDSDEGDNEDEVEDGKTKQNKPQAKKEKEVRFRDGEGNAVDLEDGFFSLDAMEEFVQQAEQQEYEEEEELENPKKKRKIQQADEEDEEDEDDEDDENNDDDEDDEGDLEDEDVDHFTLEDSKKPVKMMYTDFFDKPGESTFLHPKKDESDESDEGEAQENKKQEAKESKHQKKSKQLLDKIKELEDVAIEPKHWTLAGEVQSKERPENSLLEVPVEFSHATKIAPVITQETTDNIESMIKARIKEGKFDDVVKKDISKQTHTKEYKEIDMDKSKLSLAEIYEKEYARQVIGEDDTKRELDQKRTILYRKYKKLCYDLDSLSNFTIAPKTLIARENEIKDVGAIQMEESIPLVFDQHQTTVPEAAYKKVDKIEKGETELTTEDRKRKRRAVKRKISKQNKNDPKKLGSVVSNPIVVGNKYAKQNIMKTIKSGEATRFDRSSSFFKKIQSESNKDSTQTGSDAKKGKFDVERPNVKTLKL